MKAAEGRRDEVNEREIERERACVCVREEKNEEQRPVLYTRHLGAVLISSS